MLRDARRRLAEQDWRFIATSGFVLACLVLGGATTVGFLSDVVLQLLAIPLLLASFWRYLNLPSAERPRGVLALSVMVIAVPALQLVPLPPSLWSSLPGRWLLVESRTFIGDALPWAPVSVAPATTWLSLLSLLP